MFAGSAKKHNNATANSDGSRQTITHCLTFVTFVLFSLFHCS